MREIKFRGKRLSNGEWVYGYYYYSPIQTAHIIYESYDLPPSREDPGGDIFSEHYEVDHETVGQYTGLKDKNGTEIYKGDVISILNGTKTLRVWFIDGQFVAGEGESELYMFVNEGCEVIGNIYENLIPEKGGVK